VLLNDYGIAFTDACCNRKYSHSIINVSMIQQTYWPKSAKNF